MNLFPKIGSLTTTIRVAVAVVSITLATLAIIRVRNTPTQRAVETLSTTSTTLAPPQAPAPIPVAPQPSPTPKSPITIHSCGSNMGCFEIAAATCEPSRVSHRIELLSKKQRSGEQLVLTLTNTLELNKPPEPSECVLRVTNNNLQARFTDAYLAQVRSEGRSDEDIKMALEFANGLVGAAKGARGICHFATTAEASTFIHSFDRIFTSKTSVPTSCGGDFFQSTVMGSAP